MTRYTKEMPSKTSESLMSESSRYHLEETTSLNSCGDEDQCSCDEASYGIADAMFSTFIVAPNVVSVWRGTWGIMDIYSEIFPYVQIYILGIIIHCCFALLRAQLLERSVGAWSRPDGGACRWFGERIMSKIYTYIFTVACIMHWRGGWGIFDAIVAAIVPDETHPHNTALIAAITLICYFSTTLLRSSRNLLASPYFLFTDGKEATYIFTTRFKKTNSRETVLYVLDCIFSVAVVGSLVVFVWRGSWALLIIFIFPDDPVKSNWTSLIVGYAVVVLTFAFQAPVRWAAARLRGAPRLLLADVFHMISFIATVNVWRGVWGLLDIYLFPDSPKVSNWCSHIFSFLLLVLLNCSNSILVRGVYIDAEEPAGECVVFPCHYLRLFVHKERTKKRHKRALAAAAATASKKPEDASLPLQMPEEKV